MIHFAHCVAFHTAAWKEQMLGGARGQICYQQCPGAGKPNLTCPQQPQAGPAAVLEGKVQSEDTAAHGLNSLLIIKAELLRIPDFCPIFGSEWGDCGGAAPSAEKGSESAGVNLQEFSLPGRAGSSETPWEGRKEVRKAGNGFLL